MLFKIEDINTGLNKEQKEAVEKINGYIFNSAPPGSGKTYVLENRILWMAIEHQIPTKNILALTFTNEAANEMKQRISDSLKKFDIENNVTATTFHSFAYKIIKNFSKNKYFILIDDTDKNKILSQIIKENKLEEFDNSTVKNLSNLISSYKSKGISLNDLLNEIKNNKELIEKYSKDKELLYKNNLNDLDLKELIELHNIKANEFKIYQLYEIYKNKNKGPRLYDFDDLMLNLKELLNKIDIRKKISRLYTYILCDESQDIDEVQRDILLLLSKENGNLFCIFDDDQSIYSFRNADPDLILEMPKLVNDPQEIILKENFRSTKSIIEAANYLINNNKYRIPKWMITNNPKGELIKYNLFNSREKEADFICTEIIKLKEKYNFNYSEFVILYRNNDLNKVIEQKLIKNSLPYKINRNISFFQKKEIKDIIAYLEVIINDSTFHLERIYKTPLRGIGEKTFISLKEKAISLGMSIFEVLGLETKEKIKNFNDLLILLKEKSRTLNFKDLINFILESTNYLNLEFEEKERENRLNNIKNLINILNNLYSLFEDKKECLTQLKILSSDDDEEEEDNKINLMTIHSSKGKGYKVVFIIGCEEGVLPSFGAISDIQLEEERRLFYVGITRAKLLCYLSSCKFRIDYNGNLTKNTVSQFIEEIPEELLETKDDELIDF